jgi:hypothetical protein
MMLIVDLERREWIADRYEQQASTHQLYRQADEELLADSHIPHPSAERKFKFWKIDEVVLSD